MNAPIKIAVAENGLFALVATTNSGAIFTGGNYIPNLQEPSSQPSGYYVEPFSNQSQNIPQSDVGIGYFDTDFNLLWSTYYGGSEKDSPTSVALSGDDTRLFLVGNAVTNNLMPGLDIEFQTVDFNDFSTIDYYQEFPTEAFNTFPSWAAMLKLNVIPVGLQYIGSGGGFAIFPNPASDNVTIFVANSNYYKLQFWDLAGRLVHQENFHGNVHSISVAHLKSGMYIVQLISSADSAISGKLNILK